MSENDSFIEPFLVLGQLDTVLTPALCNPPQSPFMKGEEK
jgi:hypothetical protein